MTSIPRSRVPRASASFAFEILVKAFDHDVRTALALLVLPAFYSHSGSARVGFFLAVEPGNGYVFPD